VEGKLTPWCDTLISVISSRIFFRPALGSAGYDHFFQGLAEEVSLILFMVSRILTVPRELRSER